MTCSICGSPAADDDTFCSQCGTKLASAETKPSETSSLPAKPEPKPRTVIDRLPNAAENVVWPVAIGIAWVATFQIAASIFGGPAGLMLSSLFGLLATPLHLVLWWALWNGLRRIGSPTAKHALVFALIWTMATPVNLLSASCLYTLMGVDSATARGVLNPVSISMGLLGGVSFGSLVRFTVSVGKHHSGKLLRFSKFVWLAVAVSLMAMGVVFFSGMSLAGFLCPPTVAVVVLSFLIADILGALHPEGEKSTGVAKAAIWFAPAFAASLAVCIFAMIKIPADIHEPLNESLSAIRSAATGIPRESKTLSVRPSLQPSGGSPARARKLERLLAFFDNQPDEVLDATIESFELSIQRGRKILDPLARQRAIELVPRILKDAGIDAECRDVKNLQSQGAYSWTATAVVWTEEGGEEEVPVSMEYKKDSDMFYVTILPSEDSASESESEEDDSSETEEEIDDDDWEDDEEDEEETDDDDLEDDEEDVESVPEQSGKAELLGGINFFGFRIGMSRKDAEALAKRYGIQGGVDLTGDPVYIMEFNPLAVLRLARRDVPLDKLLQQAVTIEELLQAVTDEVGELHFPGRGGFAAYDRWTIDGFYLSFITDPQSLAEGTVLMGDSSGRVRQLSENNSKKTKHP